MEGMVIARRYAAVFGVLLGSCASALALNPAYDVSQYAHSSWKIRDGFPKGQVNSIAQTPDGYLWLGTEFGLVRFDGIKAVDWQPPAGQALPSSNIRRLLVARDGALWISTTSGLATWKAGKLTRRPEIDGMFAGPSLETRDGVVWVGARLNPGGKLCAFRSERVQCFGVESGTWFSAVLDFQFQSIFRYR